MGRFLALVAIAVCLAGSARADDPGRREFTEKVARALAAKLPAQTITIAGELELAIKRADGSQISLSLGNRYHDYARDPASLQAIVNTYAAGIAESATAGTAAKVDRARIVPVIKDRRWLAETRRMLKASGKEPVFEDLNSELVVVYAEDSSKRVRYLTDSEDLGVARKDLRKLAVANLGRILPKVEMRQHDDAFALLSAGGDYEASLLLFDDIWNGGQIKVDGDIVVAVPAKDVLLVTGSHNRKGLEVVRQLAAKFAGQQRYALTDVLFVYRNGRFTAFGGN